MSECSVNTFLVDYSPFSPDDTLVEAAKEALSRAQLLVLNGRGEPERWRDFEEEPSKGAKEAVIFKPLEIIAGAFDDNLRGLNGRQRHFFYRDCPDTEVKSEIPGCNFRVDASFIGNPNHAQNYYVICSEMAVVSEFKKSTKHFEDNREKLVSAASHIMNDDPSRKWMYGITIENTEMAVWYFSRSHSVKSEAFHFTTDIDAFIRVFLSFIYATREEMGYDPTVHRLDDEGLRYVYEIPNRTGTRYFKTIDLLAHRRVLCITGRKTRVWSAVEVKGLGDGMKEELNGGKKVALKDVWLDEGSKTEKENLDAIFESLRTVKEDAYRWASRSLHAKLKEAFEQEAYRKYFIEIVCDCFGFGRSKGTSHDATPAPGVLAFNDIVPDNNGAVVVEDPNMLPGSTQNAGYSSIPRGANDISYLKSSFAMNARSYKAKQQYRLVYKEVGESLDVVESVRTAFSAMVDTYIALVLMYLAGWVHRDISAGNIIVVMQPGGKPRGKLSDLEYAKSCDDESSSIDPKTGTAFFMPVELHTGMKFQGATVTPPQDSSDSEDDSEDVDPDDDEWPSDQNLSAQARPPPLRPLPRVKYGSQHAFESFWWVLMYLLVYRVDHEEGKALSNIIFTHTPLPTLARQQLFKYNDVVIRELEKSIHPKLKLPVILKSMNAIPPVILKSYLLGEPVDPKAMGKVCRRIYRHLAKLVLTVKTVKGVNFRPICRVQPKKRARSETSRKPRDNDGYEEEASEEASSVEIPKRKKRVNTSASVHR